MMIEQRRKKSLLPWMRKTHSVLFYSATISRLLHTANTVEHRSSYVATVRERYGSTPWEGPCPYTMEQLRGLLCPLHSFAGAISSAIMISASVQIAIATLCFASGQYGRGEHGGILRVYW